MGQLTRRALPLTSRITGRGLRRWLWAALGATALVGTVVGTFLLAVWIWPAATVLALLVSAVLRVRAWHRYLTQVRSGRPPTSPGGRRGTVPRARSTEPPAPSLSRSGSRTGGVA